ncbi:hypothetical protein LWI29_037955 [Acer saccharum]|uniref:Uncharacterized protein n=1 Tax=Acer saccharum TaxID=4024 RepID=A0AA39S289_ACESA|nr:hypothetical protein LWI29_037955 [Acer saccharum]
MDSDFHESHAALSSRSRVPSQPSLNTFGELLHSVSVGNAVGHEDRLLLNNALNVFPNSQKTKLLEVDLHAPPRSSSEALNSLPNDAIKDVNNHHSTAAFLVLEVELLRRRRLVVRRFSTSLQFHSPVNIIGHSLQIAADPKP